ncbi:GNAT family N-acetyltransferase [Liquorilactobacillus sicerae]|uniref:GNAT family N-acetyltransferase n=1 Tax=Liquorilactobacillus sicerae TaxID=1416943 RepID=UPI00247FA471|nr:GNAT family N-acetyltransferase [Liquorilactobacillus sicerae]
MDKIVTKRLVLRKATLKDLTDIFEYASNPQVAQAGGFLCCQTKQAALKFVQQLASSESWVLEERKQTKVIGNLCLYETVNKETAPDQKKKLLGYALNPKFQNQGYMTEAVAGVIDWAANQKIERIDAFVSWNNLASQCVLEKNGFEIQDIFKSLWGSNLVIKKFIAFHKVI